MVTKQIDWLTLTCLTSKFINVTDLLDVVLRTLCLKGIFSQFEYVGRTKHYAEVHRYNDISILLCKNTPKQLAHQGVCVRFSSNGLAYYNEYLKKLNIDLQTICKKWRALSVDGFFTRCSRFDFAIDDKCTSEEKPNLTMKRVHSSIDRCEVTSRLSNSRSPRTKSLPICLDESTKNFDIVGDTVYFGKRENSPVLCRFYDKRLEQLSTQNDLDDISSWVRCEFEFKQDRAMAAFNAFCDMSVDDFGCYMPKVFNNYISFIYRDDSNISRCTIKKWWADFLSTSEKSSLISPPYKPATFQSTENWLIHSVFPTLAHYIKCVGLKRFLKKIGQFMHKEPTPRIKQMIHDYDTVKSGAFKELLSASGTYDDYIRKRGLDPWLFTGNVTELDLKEDFADLCDWSDSALMISGEQLDLGDYVYENF